MLAFLQENQAELLEKTWEHISISLLSLLAAIIVAVPLGIVLTKSDKLAKIVLYNKCVTNRAFAGNTCNDDSLFRDRYSTRCYRTVSLCAASNTQ